MKKYNFLLSLLLVPAVVLQAGGTCTVGGGVTPPSLTLPGSVQGIQTYSYTTTTLYDFAVSSVSSAGAFSAGTSYGAWCTNPFALVPGGGTNPNGTVTSPEDPKNTTGSATYTPVNSYSIAAGGANNGEPGFTYDAATQMFTTTSLTLAQEWSAVNWILNNANGVSGETPTTTDTQAAIWQLLHPDNQTGYVVNTPLTPTSMLTGSSWLLYQDALANGLNFIPATGQVVAVLMVPTTPAGSSAYQSFLVPVPVACSSTGSATLTKTANVTSANAFQTLTYTYTIKNTGSTTLQDLVVVDDNGTPNFSGDDVTINLPAGTTLAPGASYSIKSTVYLPISLFYQSGNEASFDTLIPQIIPVAAGSPSGTLPSLLLTYLLDTDVTDNTYGTGASAGWAGNGGHTFAEELAGYAEFAFYNSKGTLVSEFNANYLTKGGSLPSGYESGGVIGNPIVGNKTYITNIDSTLSDNLNNFPQFNNDTVNSPVAGTPNWNAIAGYQVSVNEGIFGFYGMGTAAVVKNYLAATETGFSGKCGFSRSATYTPTLVSSTVQSTAYLCAHVCGCSTVVHAKACLSVKLNGSTQPTCNSASAHKCLNPVPCACTCAQCKAGNHAGCTHVGCTDPTCHAKNCGHNTVQCVLAGASKPSTFCW